MSEPTTQRLRWIASHRSLLLLLCVGALCIPVFANGFVFDDTMLIAGSRVIHDWRNLPALFTHSAMYPSGMYSGGPTAVDTYRPVTLATFMWDASLSGAAPWAYHLTNLLGHLCCVWLVQRLACVMLPEADRAFAWVGAAWFALSPLPAEAHVWINGRSDIFTTLFGLLAVLAWRRALAAVRGKALAWHIAATASFLCGLLSKEVLLLCIPVLACWPEPRPTPVARRLLRIAPFAVAAVVYLGMRAHALGAMRTHDNAAQLQQAAFRLPWLVIDAAFQSVLPTRPYLRLLYEEYQRAPSYVFALAGVALIALGALGTIYWRRAPVAFWGLAWFVLPLVPVAIITTMHWPGFGRYLYLPCAGLSVTITTLAAWLWRSQPRLQRVLAIALVAYGLTLAVIFEDVVTSYRTSNTLYTRIIWFQPELAHGYGMLAAALSTELKDTERVVTLLETAVRLDPTVAKYPIQLAQAQLVLQRPERAALVAERALQRFPAEPLLRYLAAVGRVDHDPEATVQHLVKCLELAPKFARCRAAVTMLCATPQLCARFRAPLRESAQHTELADLRTLLLDTILHGRR